MIGYARVSLTDQNLSRQVEELKSFGCDKIFTEKQSNRNIQDRQVYKTLRSALGAGDVLVVHDLNCLGRNKGEIRDEWEALMKDGIDVAVLKRPGVDTRKKKDIEGAGHLVSELVLTLLSWMVEEEKKRIRSAQRAGIEIAKKQGKYKGRKKKYHAGATGKDKLIYETIVKELKAQTSVMDIHRMTGAARSTIYQIKSELEGIHNE